MASQIVPFMITLSLYLPIASLFKCNFAYSCAGGAVDKI